MSGDVFLASTFQYLTLLLFFCTHTCFPALIKQLYTHAYNCVNLHWLLYTALALLKGTLVNCSGFCFCLHIHPTFPPSPAAPKHLPSLGCVALPRLSHQAPLNLTCFSHFLHQKERERERETETHSGVGRLCPREVKLKQLHWTDTRPCTKQQEPVLTHPPTAPLLSAPAAVVTGRCLVRSSPARTSPVRRGGWQQVFGASHPPHGAMQRRPVLPGSPAAANRAF